MTGQPGPWKGAAMAGKWFRGITPRRAKSPELDTSVAHPARVYDYWLGGKDNFAADREAAEAVIAVRPGIRRDIRENRKFLIRAVRYLAAEAGIRQFLDLGTGIPTSPNVHEAAQQAAPECRVVYVDNDPIVLAHARALLTSSAEGVTAYLDADLRDPDPILRVAGQTLDFSQPVGVILVGVLHLPASDVDAEAVTAGAQRYNSRVTTPQTRRSRDEVTGFFDGLDLVEPGVVQPHRWRPDPDGPPPAGESSNWAVVARNP